MLWNKHENSEELILCLIDKHETYSLLSIAKRDHWNMFEQLKVIGRSGSGVKTTIWKVYIYEFQLKCNVVQALWNINEV